MKKLTSHSWPAGILIALFLTASAAFAGIGSPQYNPGAVAITGGTINGASVGATTPGTGVFTTIASSGTTNDGSSLFVVTQSGTGRALQLTRATASATRSVVNLIQGHAAGGADAVLDIQQATAASPAINVTSNGSTSVFKVLGTGALTAASGDFGTGTLTGSLSATSTATTAAVNDSDTSIATTAYVNPGSSVTSNGYHKLPSGVLIQWGAATSSGTAVGNTTVTFPITFSNVWFVTGDRTSSGYGGQATLATFTTSGATFTASTGSSGESGINVRWFAIGN